MSRNRARDGEGIRARTEGESARARQGDEAVDQPQDTDTEGHMFINMDPSTSRQIAKGRSAEIERDLRDHKHEQEARTKRR